MGAHSTAITEGVGLKHPRWVQLRLGDVRKNHLRQAACREAAQQHLIREEIGALEAHLQDGHHLVYTAELIAPTWCCCDQVSAWSSRGSVPRSHHAKSYNTFKSNIRSGRLTMARDCGANEDTAEHGAPACRC